MSDADDFASLLLEEAKRFYELFCDDEYTDGRKAYLHSALLLGYCALEAHVNCIADDFLARGDLSILDRSILRERDIEFEKGEFVVNDKLKIFRLEDRIEYLHRRFSGGSIGKNHSYWAQFKEGLKLRNTLTHPKGGKIDITRADVEKSLEAILELIDVLYQAIYKRPYPAGKRRLTSTMNF